jgi:hypothetical protein
MELNQLSAKIIGAAITVHKELGPGLLESVYHACLLIELRAAGLKVESEVALPIVYRGQLQCPAAQSRHSSRHQHARALDLIRPLCESGRRNFSVSSASLRDFTFASPAGWSCTPGRTPALSATVSSRRKYT